MFAIFVHLEKLKPCHGTLECIFYKGLWIEDPFLALSISVHETKDFKHAAFLVLRR